MPRPFPAGIVRIALLGALLFPLLARTPASAATAAGRLADRPAAAQFVPGTPDPNGGPRAADAPGRPALRLAWAATETHAGVPAALTIQAVDADGQPDAARGGTALLLVDDARAPRPAPG